MHRIIWISTRFIIKVVVCDALNKRQGDESVSLLYPMEKPPHGCFCQLKGQEGHHDPFVLGCVHQLVHDSIWDATIIQFLKMQKQFCIVSILWWPLLKTQLKINFVYTFTNLDHRIRHCLATLLKDNPLWELVYISI